MHAKDDSKDFWTRACFVTSKDPNITKAHVRYLESRLVELTKASGRANIANGNEPSSKSLPESDVADMEFFLEQIELILPVVGFDFLKATPAKMSMGAQLLPSSEPAEVPVGLEFVIASKKHGLEAHAVGNGDEFIVLKGSGALTEEFTQNSYKALRQQLIADNRLQPTQSPQLLEFVDNVAFASPSAAAAIIFNRNTNGRTAWKLINSNMTLKDWQDAQIQEA